MLIVKHLDGPPDHFLRGEPEDAAFYRAFQNSHIPDIRVGWLAVYRGDVEISVAPYFVMDFRINTMLPKGWLKERLSWIKLHVACVGHPSLDLGRIYGDVSIEVLKVLNIELFKQASLVGYKGFPQNMPLADFVSVRNLPQATLRVPADFYEQLTSKKRNDLKRKRHRGAAVRIVEHCGRSSGLEETLAKDIHRLYLNTFEKAHFQLEKLTSEYFVLTAPRSTFLLCYEGDQLIGFAQVLGDGSRLALKYVGMDYERGPQFGVWFLLYLQAIDFCIRTGHDQIDLGPTSYTFKSYIGCELIESWLYYRHRNVFAHWLLGKLAFLLEPSESDLQ